jgi:hypothetical protein
VGRLRIDGKPRIKMGKILVVGVFDQKDADRMDMEPVGDLFASMAEEELGASGYDFRAFHLPSGEGDSPEGDFNLVTSLAEKLSVKVAEES